MVACDRPLEINTADLVGPGSESATSGLPSDAVCVRGDGPRKRQFCIPNLTL